MLVILAAFAASILVFCATLNLLRHRCHNNARNSRKSSLPLHFASTPNVMFAYHQCGKPSDPLVLVLHGFPDTAASMCTILSSLAAQGHHAVAPYLPGYFPSSLAADDDYSLVAVSRSVMHLIEALGHRQAVIIGHDWGGYIAITAAKMHPDVVSRIAVLCVPHMLAFMSLPLKQIFRSWYVFLFQAPFFPHRMLPAWNFAFVDLLYQTWSAGHTFSDSHMQHVKETLSRPGCARAAVRYYTGLRSFASLKVMFSKCNVPAMQLAGRYDGCMGADVFPHAKRGFADSYELVFLNVGHFPHIEGEVDLMNILLRWLSST